MKYFSIVELVKSETARKYGIDNRPGEKERIQLERLINEILDPIREEYGGPIMVTSGFRCRRLNDVVKGSKTSQHMKGEAADLVPVDGDTRRLFDVIRRMMKEGKIKCGQLIWEYGSWSKPKWVHISLPGKSHNQILYIGVK